MISAAAQDTFGSVADVRFGCREPGSASFIELRPARLRRAVLNGRELDPGTLHGNRLPLPGLREANELRVEADMTYSRDGAGLHRFTDAADGETYLALHAGLDNAQRVFAAFDQPDLKAAITASIVAPGSWTVLGNGVARPAGQAGAPDCLRWALAATPPISSYLFTLVAGPYYSVRSEHRGIPFGLHSRRSLAGALDRDAAEILAITRACFDRYLEIFAEPYPFDSYDQAFVPELEAGAVENPGCITFRDEFLFPFAVTYAERQTRGMVIAHEMAHMWFGDLVTMAWWNDVWLSESFATYMGFQVLAEATAFTGAWTDFALARKPRGYDSDQRASTHPVAPGPQEVPDTDAARAAYDDISYAKGASALRQLVAWTGWPAFIAGINDYLARYRFASATLDDLLDCLARSSGADLRELGRALAAHSGRGHPRRPARGPPGRGRDSSRTPGAGRTGCGSGCTTGRPVTRASWSCEPGSRSASGPTRARSRCRRPPPTRRPPCCCRTTATSATARCGSTRAPGPPWPRGSAACPIRSAAPWPGTPSATWSATRSCPRRIISSSRPGTCRPRPRPRSPGRCWASPAGRLPTGTWPSRGGRPCWAAWRACATYCSARPPGPMPAGCGWWPRAG